MVAGAVVYNSRMSQEETEVLVISEPVDARRVHKLAESLYGDMVKAVVDTSRRVVALGGDLHSDEETVLLGQGSQQTHLWGINIYPDKPRSEWIEFDSMINIRPRQNNRSRYVEDEETRRLISEIVNSLVL